jgi:hypothetical protein
MIQEGQRASWRRNLYLCCHGYYQASSFGNLKDSSLKALLASSDRKESLHKLRKQFCIHCPYAIPVDALHQSTGSVGLA